MTKKSKLDNFHYHEVIDRLYLIANLLDEALMDHPVVKKHKVVRNKIKRASKELIDAYQLTGGITFDKFHKDV